MSVHGFEQEVIKEATVQEAFAKGIITHSEVLNLRAIEKWLHEKNYIFFNNYCRVLQEFQKLSKPVTVGSGKNQQATERVDPNWISPGIIFLRDLAKCQTEQEWKDLLNSVGVFQFAPDGGIRTVLLAVRNGFAKSAAKVKSAAGYLNDNAQVEEATKTVRGVLLAFGGFVALLIIAAFVLVILLGNQIQF